MTAKISLGPQGEPLFDGTPAEIRAALGLSVVAGTGREDEEDEVPETLSPEEWQGLAAKYAPMCESGALELIGLGPQKEPLFKYKGRFNGGDAATEE